MSNRNGNETTTPTDTGPPIHSIGVVGAGTMGHGIAVAFAVGERSVRLYDPDPGALEAAQNAIENTVATLVSHEDYPLEAAGPVLDAITFESELPSTVEAADLVVEAVPEDQGIKTEAFERIERHTSSETIVASNTSSLSIDTLGTTLDRPERFLGTHWFHPPHIVPVVEVVRGKATSDRTVARVHEVLERVGKTPVVVQKDIPGFIGNRIQTAMAHEAWSLLNAGVASAEDIDKAVKGTFGFRLPALGVFEKGDHSGLDIHAKVLDELLGEIDRSTSPSESLLELVDAGRHGVKTEKGVYDWTDVDIDQANKARDSQLLSLLAVYQQRERPAPIPETDQ